MSKISGSCLCGAVRYSTSAEPAMMAVCHCTDCQKQSGSAFSINVLVPRDQLEVEGEALTQFDVKGNSGANVSRNFCNLCGSPLFNVLDHFGGMAAIKAGTMDDSSWVKPGVQIWCDSARSWGVLDDDIEKEPQNPS